MESYATTPKPCLFEMRNFTTTDVKCGFIGFTPSSFLVKYIFEYMYVLQGYITFNVENINFIQLLHYLNLQRVELFNFLVPV